MTASGRPVLVATLPGRTLAATRREVSEAARAGADAAEVRFDRMPTRERARAHRLFPSPLPLIATYRSDAEGGLGSSVGRARSALLARLGDLPFLAIDRELARDRPPTGAPAADTIWSAHRPRATGIRSALAEGEARRGPGDLVKVVAPVDVRTAIDLIETMPGGRLPSRSIVMTTGGSGALLRALGRRLGASAVYGSLPGRSAVESSQVPVDRLKRFFSGPTDGPLYALLGRSVLESRSPSIFEEWFRALRVPGLYVPLNVGPDERLSHVVPRLARWGFRGVNVTQPAKVEALSIAGSRSRDAVASGCANTLRLGPRGGIRAENTDVAAVRRRLAELRDRHRWDGREALVIGTGGAARAALAALVELGASTSLIGRTSSSVRALAREFGARDRRDRPTAPGSLVIQATSVGRRGSGGPGFPLRRTLARASYVLDFVYAPSNAIVARTAKNVGVAHEDGHRLLVYQAVESFRFLTGRAVPAPLVASALARRT